ncbi:aldo-keto reductase family 1 member B1-like [Antedon mediterranea]|uniref:aldo-keto reductase family 1 member B1-like n=1 Tax=Antedon mediterranea TaxID=105859 RepID=UPI003AF6AF0F
MLKNALKLQSGALMPIIGLGTWQSKPGEVENAVKAAISMGYRHIDCARAYQNEGEVGTALKAKFDDGTVKREDLFITSKLWNTYHHPDDVMKSFQDSLELLGLDYVDLYLIHWPMAYKRGDVMFPKDDNGKFLYAEEIPFTDTWKALEELVSKGLCKSIGVSNFNQQQIEQILAMPNKVPVAVNQIELHPYLTQEPMVEFCKSKGIVVTAYSPLGSPQRPWVKETDPSVMDDPIVVEIANRYKKSPAQVLIRFAVERGIVVIPKSVTPSRIQANFESMNFELKPEDVRLLLNLNKNYRGCALEWIFDHKDHPFAVTS